MTDVDELTQHHPLTGAPMFDDRSAAERWNDALHNGPEHYEGAPFHYPQNLSAQSGPIQRKHHKSKAAPTAAQQKKQQNNMSNKHNRDLLKASELNLETIERLLLEYGFEAEIDSTWIQVKMPKWSLFIKHVDDLPAVDLAGAIELRQGISLRKTLRFLNYLNNEDRVVRFSLWEPPSHDAIDMADLWANVALPIRSGFSSKQFIGALDLLLSGLDYAFTAAVEAGLAEPPCATWQCGCEHEEVVGYGL